MIQAERLLLLEALKDPLNERFFLLSDRWVVLTFAFYINVRFKQSVGKENIKFCSKV